MENASSLLQLFHRFVFVIQDTQDHAVSIEVAAETWIVSGELVFLNRLAINVYAQKRILEKIAKYVLRSVLAPDRVNISR